MYERFTDRARKVMAMSNQEAQRFNHEYIGTEHILLGLVKEGSGVGATVLKNLNIDLRKVRLEVEKLVKSGPDMVTMGKLPHTPRTKKVIEYSIEEARVIGHNYVGTEHLLLGLLREKDGVAAQVLMSLGVKLDEARLEALNIVGEGVEADTAEDAAAADIDEDALVAMAAIVRASKGAVNNAGYDAWFVFSGSEETASTVCAVANGPVAAFSWIASCIHVTKRTGYWVQGANYMSNGVLVGVGLLMNGGFEDYYRMTDAQISEFLATHKDQ